MKKPLAFLLALLAILVTGCPHNEYLIDLTPNGPVIERMLTFYRTDGVNTNTGVPDYQEVDINEVAAIDALYPPRRLGEAGRIHFARGSFSNALPPDVGGAGSYTNLSNYLGVAGFYIERFRGNDDLSGIIERRFRAADQLTDLLLGWTRAELGNEPGYGALRQFIDANVRRDLKNVGAYAWDGRLSNLYSTNALEEFAVRLWQYQSERGYIQMGDVPMLARNATEDDFSGLRLFAQRFVARKMGIPDSQPVPQSLAFLSTDEMVEKSLNKYLTTTTLYSEKLKQWQLEKKAKPDEPKPEPSSVAGDIAMALTGFDLDFFGTKDHLKVHLALPLPPTHSNGKWDESLKQVVWDTDLETRTNDASLPVVCYANWSVPADAFQKEHFGQIALSGDDLTAYCVWRSSLDVKEAVEWDALLVTLHPGNQLTNTLNAFRFPGEPLQIPANRPSSTNASSFGRELIINSLKITPR